MIECGTCGFKGGEHNEICPSCRKGIIRDSDLGFCAYINSLEKGKHKGDRMKSCILASRKEWQKSTKPVGEQCKEIRKVIRENEGLTSWQIAEKLGYDTRQLHRLLKHKVIRFTQQPHPECGCRHQRYYETPMTKEIE